MPLDQPSADALAGRLARARSRSVFICSPIARHPVRQFTTSLVRTTTRLAELGIPAYVQNVVGSSNLPRARNELVAAFMASDYTDLLFVDDDMGWDPNDVVRLLASDEPLIGAVGCKKVERPDTDPEKWCVRVLKGQPLRQNAMGAIAVRGVGTGFLKIERRVFEQLAAAHPERKRTGWATMPEAARRWYYRFFAFGDDGDETGEDFAFCDDWRALGGDVWVDPAIRLLHVGEKEYSGDFTAVLEAAETMPDMIASAPAPAPVSIAPIVDEPLAREPYLACPLCASVKFRPTSYADCSRHPLYHPRLPAMMVWCTCDDCGHGFTDGTFGPEAEQLLFARTNPSQAFGADYERKRPVAARIVERLTTLRPPCGDWLDIGFGDGALLLTAAEFGFTPIGVETRQANVDAARAFGIEACRPGSADKPARDRRVCVISLADVLEHIADPVSILRTAHAALVPGGNLFLSMPNSDCAMWRIATERKANLYWGEIEHYHNFGRDRLIALLEQTGFTPVHYAVSERYRMGMEVIAVRKETP